jgi:hypothetical protein
VTASRARLRLVYVRALAGVHAIALLSVLVQADLLVGDRGLLPVARTLPALAARVGHTPWLDAPTLLWLDPSQGAVHALIDAGLGLALLLALGAPWEGPLLLALGAVYLSLVTVGGPFLRFQWDSLLIESTFVALFVARWRRGAPEPPRWAWALQHWLVFRLMFFGGLVKLTSGDPHWADWTALDYHFWTQPLPNPLSRWAHSWPSWLHAAGVAFTFVVELALPFLIPFGRVARAIAAAGFAALMGMLAATGNYGFFQLLAVVLCLPLLDDRWFGGRAEPLPTEPDWRRHVAAPIAALWVGVTLLWAVGYDELPRAGQSVLEAEEPFHLANPYGLFAVMTTDRIEIVLQGSWDGGRTWTDLPTRYKPGDLDRTPPQVAPHMPRLDWQLWFAGLSTCDRNPWLVRLMRLVVDGSPPALDAFAPGTFDRGPPEQVRALAYRYTFAPPASAAVWEREELGLYCADAVERRSSATP